MKKFIDFINEEVGEKILPPYSYHKDSESDLVTYYKFVTEDGDQYSVRFFNQYYIQPKEKFKDQYQVEFITSDEKGDHIIVNKGRFYKVLATVIAIIKEFTKQNDPKVLKISPVSNFKKDKRRKNIYINYIEKLLPDDYKYKKSFFGDDLYIIKK